MFGYKKKIINGKTLQLVYTIFFKKIIIIKRRVQNVLHCRTRKNKNEKERKWRKKKERKRIKKKNRKNATFGKDI